MYFCPVKRKEENIEVLSEKKLELIEKIGVFFSEGGMKPSTARIQALLLVSDKVELTFDEIREILDLSKSATSNGLNFLLTTKRIDYVRKRGDRKRYFRSKIETWKDSFIESFNFLISFTDLLNEVRELRPDDTKVFNSALDDLVSFMKYAQDEMLEIYKRWEEKKNLK